MRFLRQSLIGLVLTALTLVLLLYAGNLVRGAVQERMSRVTKAPPARERTFAVTLVRAEAGDVVPELDTFGEVQSRRTLELRAAVAGRVTEMADSFEDGGSVAEGDVLVQLDPADAQSTLDRVQADIADAKAELRDAQRTLDLNRDDQVAAQEQADLREKAFQRQVDLETRGVGTAAAVETAELAASAARQAVLSRRQAVTSAEARIDQANTTLARTEIALAEAQRRLADTTLRAPFDGTLSLTNVTLGRLVSANEKLADLIDPDALEVSFRVSTAQYARLLDDAGALLRAPVQVTLDVAGIDLQATGTISRASVEAGEAQTGRLVFARLDGARGFKPGDFVTVKVQEPELQDVIRLPSSALGADDTVLVLGEGDRLETIRVAVLRRQGDTILVRGDGLEGREVVEARSPLLGAGIAVTPLRIGREEAVPAVPEMLELSAERRARLVAFVEANDRMPQEAKARVLAQLAEPQVPAQMVARIESRMGG
ncbi:efflux RND transporter periplasmic adaptor subunit [Pseudosulfitobacter pseudonitzschiae]|uniref:efflux RND transporter periplasmic adaptor subunit n=1 Tax=Pseudosulfitobacter pseudonitzschiae TaxID=1402135 RepID=UPI001AF73108|nr:efflux RND transporter periplasmic adaptor subunit [Pseudosulfitobacter pseudonitzschiae]MBM1814199.1 efflux RND transporter periplasmic adaptor subunit [Pseudosulfitobacter pseudonitzschiae]MBM1831192.1 efflux RND transporter periplasmic adaptor subunit [Pseudosulfitobacter pseudonitzschiae]MBM1836059.1 efflux RND transporter periplasmic adaptor subunit [Pseudosulfitobacter pseudonitzschiae]MBM1840905.1 efflux RND transporter periplasmic adaptor subunit [Pseudosulfitobacter pseudonitzschiae